MRPQDKLPPLDRALYAAANLKAGTWESVEALAVLAIEAKGRSECASLQHSAHSAAAGLKAGSWDSVRALSFLARADRELS